jgi:hypothetical protein
MPSKLSLLEENGERIGDLATNVNRHGSLES